MKENEAVPDDWTTLEKDDRSSTVAWFVKGWKSPDGVEILVWRGVEHEGEVMLELPSYANPPEGAEYVVEVLDDGKLKEQKFGLEEGEAINRGLQQVVVESGDNIL